MPFIRFVRDHTVKAVGGATYHTDDIVECSDDAAGHFTSRGLAVRCEAPQVTPQPEELEGEEPKPKRGRRSKPFIEEQGDDGEQV